MSGQFESNIGPALRSLRRDRGVTQETLAENADLSPAYYGQVERNERTPSVASMCRIAAALGMGLPDLVHHIAGDNAPAGLPLAPCNLSMAKKNCLSDILDALNRHFPDTEPLGVGAEHGKK